MSRSRTIETSIKVSEDQFQYFCNSLEKHFIPFKGEDVDVKITISKPSKENG